MPSGNTSEGRKARLAAALRANLARRKQQARERALPGDAEGQQRGAECSPSLNPDAADIAAGTVSPQSTPKRGG